MNEQREGQVQLTVDPGDMNGDAHIVFIGKIWTPWNTKKECPRSGRQNSEICEIEVFEAFRDGLTSMETCTHLFILYWMHEARRNLIVQAPRFDTGPRGCFTIRSPVRPNPVSLSAVELISVDRKNGRLKIRGLDCLDGTPLVDIKPYFSKSDNYAHAHVDWDAD